MADAVVGGRRPGGTRLRIGVALVRGDSMRPTLRPDDRLLVVYGARVRAGRVVVARFADGTLVVKRATERRGSGWWLRGDNPGVGVDSRHRGPVPDEAVLGVVRARLWPRPRTLGRFEDVKG
ncbi:nickel-type superoxide dismutase maturation protease [Nocardioides carbamazepini]|uniref:nickel-type superoxide dismutase maturation protease n=1 Tax=Nocardioides carbamazepini TaxID=2854259 RepID=UPI00214A3C19|nr:nickel-type superoxide dismutase maturation protease [Nocardioides carbamazepini]MCR1781843.1 nickel-type superoxide dismutase maturation protease [Nocardioides carbamazepini]